MTSVDAELKNLENSIRNLLEFVLKNKFGPGWIESLRISSGRIERWKERREVEGKRLSGAELEDRLLYYADFYDLGKIIKRHWDDGLSEVFKDLSTVSVFLTEMEKLRDPNAHRRELRPYQRHLILGVSGELRTRIMKYRGRRDDVDAYFPVLEAVCDSRGHKESNPRYAQIIVAGSPLRVGDEVEIQAFSTDPLGGDLEYCISKRGKGAWSANNWAKIRFEEEDIGKTCDVQVKIRSQLSCLQRLR